MMDETLKALLAIRAWMVEPAVSPEGPDEMRMYIMIGKTAMFVDTMSTMLPMTTPFRDIRFILPCLPNVEVSVSPREIGKVVRCV